MIRTIIMILIFMFSAAIPVFSADDQGTTVKKERSDKPRKKGNGVWPQPFQPSEEVGADSQVSFPTDI